MSDPWDKVPNLSGQTAGGLEDSRTGDPSRFYATGAGGVDDAVSQRILNQPRCKIFRTAAQALTASVVYVVSFDGIEYDTDGMFSTANPTRLTCRTPGVYAVVGSCFYTATGGDNTWSRLVMGNTSTQLTGVTAVATGGGFTMEHNLSGHWVAKAGDWLELWMLSVLASNITAGQYNVYLAVCRISTLGSDN